MLPSFRCPRCGYVAATGEDVRVCSSCGRAHTVDGCVFDLVASETDRAAEQDFYDSVYGAGPKSGQRDIAECEALWCRAHQPELAAVRRAAGSMTGKDVLLLGNGASQKELAFLLESPRMLVYSDLTVNASLNIRSQYDFSRYQDCMMFAAIDAQAIPFCEQSFDTVYGFAMVHHLPDLAAFVHGVKRVLRPGGVPCLWTTPTHPCGMRRSRRSSSR